MIRPLARRVILRLDEEDRNLGSGLVRAADRHYHQICLRCHQYDAALSGTRCTPEPIFERDWKGREQLRAYDYSHDTRVVTADVVVETWRKATVVAVGEAGVCCCEDEDDCECGAAEPLEVGDRVFVRFDVGSPLPPGDVGSPIRVVFADAIPFVVEEE